MIFLVALSKKVRLRIPKFTYSTPVPEEILDTIGDSQHEGDDRKIEYAPLLLFHWQMHPCLVSKLKWKNFNSRNIDEKRTRCFVSSLLVSNSKPIFQQKKSMQLNTFGHFPELKTG